MTSPHKRFALVLAGIVACVGLSLAQAPTAVADTSWGLVAPNPDLVSSMTDVKPTKATPAPGSSQGKKRSPIAGS